MIALPALLAATSATGADAYRCVFDLYDHAIETVLHQTDTGWRMQFEDGTTAAFDDLGNGGGDLLRLVSSEFDRDAGAIALITIALDESAFLSFHGQFPTHDAKTYSGTCSTKDG